MMRRKKRRVLSLVLVFSFLMTSFVGITWNGNEVKADEGAAGGTVSSVTTKLLMNEPGAESTTEPPLATEMPTAEPPATETPTSEPTATPTPTATPEPTLFAPEPPTLTPELPEPPATATPALPTGEATATAPAGAADRTLHNPMKDENGNSVWDTVYFGSYYQSDTNGDGKADSSDEKEPIRWRVLAVNGDDAFLAADKNLDAQPYNISSKSVSWAKSTIRSWLNGYGAEANSDGEDYSSDNFIQTAFTPEEQDAISKADGRNYGTEKEDKVFLLSYEEVVNESYGFRSSDSAYNKARIRKNTAYARGRGAYTDTNSGAGYWWLRSPGEDTCHAVRVDSYGNVYRYGSIVDDGHNAAAPALHLDLSSSNLWTKGKQVSADGDLELPVVPTPAPTRGPAAETLHNPVRDADGNPVWDTVYFGSYWQNDTNGDGVADRKDAKEPIRWRVLSLEGNRAFLVADKNLDVQKYNASYSSVTWEKSTMRSWLNGYSNSANNAGVSYSASSFIKNAFTSEEWDAICMTDIDNKNNPYCGTNGGANTKDKIFLLSCYDTINADYGFQSSYSRNDRARIRKNTAYVAAGGTICSSGMAGSGRADSWWLRTPGSNDQDTLYVNRGGYVGGSDASVDNRGLAVCPALYLDLSSLELWQKGEPVSPDGDIGASGAPTLTPLPPTATPAIATAMPTPVPSDGFPHNPRYDADGNPVWDTVYFGFYWQSDTNGDGVADQKDRKEPIRWRVLSVDGEDAFLVSDKILDSQKYETAKSAVSWKNSTVRSWLNGYGASYNSAGTDYSSDNFIQNAFTLAEQESINVANVTNAVDLDDIGGVNDTYDKVFLLSDAEAANAWYGFQSSKVRAKTRTAYAQAGYSWNAWWLRSPGYYFYDAICISSAGSTSSSNINNVNGICPALHLNLSASHLWKMGEPISLSEASAAPTATPDPSTPTLSPTETPDPALPTPAWDGSLLHNPVKDADGNPVWDTVYFGSYWQGDTNGDGTADRNDWKESIRWRVLSVNGNDAFLVADKNLDVQKYSITDSPVTWEKSTMRSWLNGYNALSNQNGIDYSSDNFIKNAFTSEEQNAIYTTEVKTGDNPESGAGGSSDTEDKVFLLSYEEATDSAYGFLPSDKNDEARIRENTAYVTERGLSEGKDTRLMRRAYWLRSPGKDSSHAVSTYDYGGINRGGDSVDNDTVAVCPALHLDISATDLWQKGKQVSAKGDVETPILPTVAPTQLPVETPDPDMPTQTPGFITAEPSTATPPGWELPTATPSGISPPPDWELPTATPSGISPPPGWELPTATPSDISPPPGWELTPTAKPTPTRRPVSKATATPTAGTATPKPTREPTEAPAMEPTPTSEPTEMPNPSPTPTFAGTAGKPSAPPMSSAARQVDLSNYQAVLLGDLEEGESSYARYDREEGALTVTGKNQLILKLPERAGQKDSVTFVFQGTAEKNSKLAAYLADENQKAVSQTAACQTERQDDGAFIWEFTLLSEGNAEAIVICGQGGERMHNLKLWNLTAEIKKGIAVPAQTTVPPSGNLSPPPSVSDKVPAAPVKTASAAGTGKEDDGEKDSTSAASKAKVKAPAQVQGLSAIQKKRNIQLKWKKAARAKGYQVCLSQSRKFKKNTMKNTKKTSLTLKKKASKSKKQPKSSAWYVRVRAYTTSKGKKVYGKWSKVKVLKLR